MRYQAESALGDKVKWVGKLPSNEVRGYMAAADCLVLPSLYDGWGAVVSEALMCGTPVICSDTCGSAGVVERSGVGSVFGADVLGNLKISLQKALNAGPVSREQRCKTIAWSDALGAQAAAQYLLGILTFEHRDVEKPQPPWNI